MLIIYVALFASGAIATLGGLRWWLRVNRRRVQRLVADGQADWAALCRVAEGARYLEGAQPSGSRLPPTGVMSVQGDRLTWSPGRADQRRGHHAAALSLSGFRCQRVSFHRDITGTAVREVHLTLAGDPIVLFLYAESGSAPGLIEKSRP